MPGCRLKVPLEVRNLLRRLRPALKRKLRVALRDMLEDLAAVSGSEQSKVLLPQRNCHGDSGGGVLSRDRFSSSSIFFV
jgi:hypothetical protein